MTLHAKFRLTRGRLALDVDLDIGANETVAIVGRNGAGKTSLLLAVAGLLPIDAGEIRFGADVLDDGTAANFVDPQRRGVGFVFQDHLLFPHMTANANVAFGLRSRGVARDVATATAAEWLTRVGVGDLGARRPSTLSGGQCQRVALARALALTPRILLLDEPLAAVDASARAELRRELRTQLQATAGVRLLVVHSAVDAFALADRIAVVEDGRIVQVGTVAQICSRPRTRYVADLVGLNFVRGVAHGGVVTTDAGGRLVVANALDGAVVATFHPRAVALYRERPAGSPRNVWRAPVVGIEPSLDGVRVQLGGELPLVAEITPAALADLAIRVGAELWVVLKATEVGVAVG